MWTAIEKNQPRLQKIRLLDLYIKSSVSSNENHFMEYLGPLYSIKKGVFEEIFKKSVPDLVLFQKTKKEYMDRAFIHQILVELK